jgi:hypothetical protein
MMSRARWHKLYTATVNASPERLFALIADMPNYTRWLPASKQFSHTTAVEPYPVQLGSRYHDGQPDKPGKDWWGTVTGFQPPGSIDFHHTIRVPQVTLDGRCTHPLLVRDRERPHPCQPLAPARPRHAAGRPTTEGRDHRTVRQREHPDDGGPQAIRRAACGGAVIV